MMARSRPRTMAVVIVTLIQFNRLVSASLRYCQETARDCSILPGTECYLSRCMCLNPSVGVCRMFDHKCQRDVDCHRLDSNMACFTLLDIDIGDSPQYCSCKNGFVWDAEAKRCALFRVVDYGYGMHGYHRPKMPAFLLFIGLLLICCFWGNVHYRYKWLNRGPGRFGTFQTRPPREIFCMDLERATPVREACNQNVGSREQSSPTEQFLTPQMLPYPSSSAASAPLLEQTPPYSPQRGGGPLHVTLPSRPSTPPPSYSEAMALAQQERPSSNDEISLPPPPSSPPPPPPPPPPPQHSSKSPTQANNVGTAA